jgi:hypothetical protein
MKKEHGNVIQNGTILSHTSIIMVLGVYCLATTYILQELYLVCEVRITKNISYIANEGRGLSYTIRRWGQVKLLYSTIILYLSECMNNEEYTVCFQNVK